MKFAEEICGNILMEYTEYIEYCAKNTDYQNIWNIHMRNIYNILLEYVEYIEYSEGIGKCIVMEHMRWNTL